MIFAMMAGILHLSNIDFAPDPEIQQIIIVNEEEVDYSKFSKLTLHMLLFLSESLLTRFTITV